MSQENIHILKAWKSTEDIKFRPDFYSNALQHKTSIQYKNCFGHLTDMITGVNIFSKKASNMRALQTPTLVGLWALRALTYIEGNQRAGRPIWNYAKGPLIP